MCRHLDVFLEGMFAALVSEPILTWREKRVIYTALMIFFKR